MAVSNDNGAPAKPAREGERLGPAQFPCPNRCQVRAKNGTMEPAMLRVTNCEGDGREIIRHRKCPRCRYHVVTREFIAA